MLTVYSTQGSPGASTTAMHLAANWASAGREVLLIELDPAGGSLSHNLGIQFTPGSASFVASGLPVLSNHLIDHAQDVLFENLHVMPTPASPSGARGIFNTFSGLAEDLRAISENEMAVIIDGGRVTADTAASALTTGAAGVVVVCGSNSQMPSLEHLKGVLHADDGGHGPVGCAVSVGKSPMDHDEWLETCGLNFCGSIEYVSDMTTDLSAYMARSKRKSKKWRASLEEVGENLYRYAHPPVSEASQRRRAAALAAPSHSEAPETAETAETADGAGVPAPAPVPAAAESQPGHPQSHYLPPSVGLEGYGQAPPPVAPEGYPAYDQPAPPPEVPPQYPAHPHEQPYPPPQYPAGYEQPYPPPQDPAHPYEQPYPPQHPADPYNQPQHPADPYNQPQYPAAPFEEPAPPPYEQPAPHPQHPAYPERPATPYEQSHPVPGAPPNPAPPQPAAPQPAAGRSEPPPKPHVQPTGSFRDWALKLHGSDADDVTARRGG